MTKRKRQVVVIGGGETFDFYKDYLRFFSRLKFDPYEKRASNWKDSLQKDLGNKYYEVIKLSMPNPLNAQYEEWKIQFRKLLPYLRDNVILLGHSLGALFLVKYLSENRFLLKIKGLLLVACPHGGLLSNLNDFVLEADLRRLRNLKIPIHFFHSMDDQVVRYYEGKDLAHTTKATLHSFKKRGHFIFDKHFPEVVEVIKSL